LDPSGLEEQGWNRYSYVLNNPLNAFDPLGLAATPVNATPIEAGSPIVFILAGMQAPHPLAKAASITIGVTFVVTGVLTIDEIKRELERAERPSIILESRKKASKGEDEAGFEKSTDGTGDPRKKSEQQKRIDKKRKQDARSKDRTVEDASQKVEDVRDFAPDQQGHGAEQEMNQKLRENLGPRTRVVDDD
jgi:uncharacterized protein RhaS with RHS repeats